MVKMKEKQKIKPSISSSKKHGQIKLKNPYKNPFLNNIHRNCKTRSTIIQRYCIFTDNANNEWTQASPLNRSSPRQVMVNEKRPATLYLRENVNPPNELELLGIRANEHFINDPNPNGEGRFKEFCQGMIPSVVDEIEDIPENEQTFLQKLFSCCSPPTRQCATRRSDEDQQTALNIFYNQQNYLTTILEILNQVSTIFSSHNMDANALQQLREQLNAQICEWSQSKPSYGLKALGTDIICAVMALYELTYQEYFTHDTFEDIEKMIQMLRDELNYRNEQITCEINTVSLMPQIPTECKESAMRRSYFIDSEKKEREEGHIDKGSFSDIHWSCHYATNIPVQDLTPDSLMIEDAVGKSSSGAEAANAHWAAHIYGQNEHLSPNSSSNLSANILDCKFNQMSLSVRNTYFSRSGIQNTDFWEISYLHESIDNNHNPSYQGKGIIRIELTNDYKFKYTIKANEYPPGSYDYAPFDFMSRLAATVVDGLLIQDFALRGFDRWDSSENPGTQQQNPASRLNKIIKMYSNFTSKISTGTSRYRIEEIK